MAIKSHVAEWRQFNGDAQAWDRAFIALESFPSLHQSFAWGEARSVLGWRVLRCEALDEHQKTIALVQVLVRLAGPGVGLCWIPGGSAGDLSLCDASMRKFLACAIGTTFVFYRMNLLRELTDDAIGKLKATGWKRASHKLTTGLSMLYDLSMEEPERLALASGNWRHNLRRSAKYGLTIERWFSPVAAEIAQQYQEMESLKGLEQQFSIEELHSLIAMLGDRLLLYRCLDGNGRMIALRGCGIFGANAWDLFAATTPSARKVYASHALFWALTSECKRLGVQIYDLSGIDPLGNKGVYDFKKGTGAKHIEYLGEWEYANFPGLRWIANVAMKFKGIRA